MHSQAIVRALYANALIMGALLLVVFFQGSHVSLTPSVLAAEPAFPAFPQASQSRNLMIVPAQMSGSTWGCYLMDPDAQVLCVYQYVPGEKLLRLQAARNIAYDRKLGAFNTDPLPSAVAELVAREAKGVGGKTDLPPGAEK